MTWPIGRKIVGVRAMLPSEMSREGWDDSAVVLELDDGSIIFPSQDEEGNGPGALFSCDAGQGTGIVIPPISRKA